MWVVYKLSSGVLPVRSLRILKITFCLPTVPISGLGCPPACSSPCLEKEEWLSLQLWLSLVVPGSLHSAPLHPGVLWVFQLLFLPTLFAAQGCLPHPGLDNTAVSHVWLFHTSPWDWCCSAQWWQRGQGLGVWDFHFLWKVWNVCCQLLCATVSSCRGELVCSSSSYFKVSVPRCVRSVYSDT